MGFWGKFKTGLLTVGKVAGKAALGAAVPAAVNYAEPIVVKANPWAGLIFATVKAAVMAEQTVAGEKQGINKAAFADARIEGAWDALEEDLLGDEEILMPEAIEDAKKAFREVGFHLGRATGRINNKE